MRTYSLRAIAVALLLFPFLSASAITRNWVGSVSSNWAEPNNWSPAGVPTAADSLVFPSTGSTTNNDLPSGTTIGPVHFNGGNNTLSGNPLTLSGTIDFSASAGNFICNADLKLGAPIQIGPSGVNVYNGALDVNGQTLDIGSYGTGLSTLNGSGTVNIYALGDPLAIYSGSFSGTINGSVDVAGSVANANLSGPRVSGNGTVGNVTALKLWPGRNYYSPVNNHNFGTLHTKNLSVTNEYAVDLSSGTYDSTAVTGSVSVAGSLVITFPSSIPSAGQSFTIIANDSNDAVSGTFTGLTEGAVIIVSGVPFTISYHGGDGNDVVLTTQLTTKTWTGNASSFWSNSGNWTPQVVPVPGEPLIFGAGNYIMVNDLPSGTAVGALTFKGGNPDLSGNSLTLMGDVDVNVSFSCQAPLKIGAPLTMNSGTTSRYDAIDVNGQTLTLNSAYFFSVTALNGSGTVNANGLGVQLESDSTFSGTITGTWNVVGSVPNANVNATTLTGTGMVGNVVVSYLRPGSNVPGVADVHNAGSLRTRSLTITQQYSVDLTTNNDDETFVTGTVTLTGASLAVSMPSGNPPAGTHITIISNDGSDPVVGTFTGLAEGATLTASGMPFTISYHGGDGNDVTLTALGGARVWVGGNFGGWSSASNWSPQGIPVAGEPLVFSIGTSNMTNNLPSGFTVGALTFKGGNVQLTGNALTLTGDVKFESSVSGFSCVTPLTIGSALTLGAAPNSFYSVIDVNGKTLTVNTSPTMLGRLSGSGTIELTGPGAVIETDGLFTGAIHGSVQLSASLPNADITAPFLSGIGTAGKIVVTTLRPGFGGPSDPDLHSVGVLHTKSLTLAGGSFDVDLFRNPDGASDLVQVTGTVSLSGALNVSLPYNTGPVFGQAFVILDNDGTDKINGTFTNLPEGAAVHSGNYLFRISYTGGDGNDVELTAAIQPAIAVTHAKSSTFIGEQATFIASFAAGSPSPLGTLTFAADGSPIGTAPIVNGSASLALTSLAIGDRVITASFSGGGAFLAAVSAPLTHMVRPGATSTTLEAVDPLVYGSSRFHVTAAVSAPAVTPLLGSVTLRENGIIVGTANLNGAAAIIAAPSLGPGTHVLVASYAGSSSLLASNSTPLTVSIAPAETRLVVSHDETPSAADGNVRLNIVVSPASGASALPTGTVTIAEYGNAITHESINGTTSIKLTLTPGAHNLTVSYSGDANFLGDTTAYTVTIASATPSRHRGVRH